MRQKEVILKAVERGVKLTLADKFAQYIIENERDISLRAEEIFVMVRALGETLDTVEFPRYWRRLLARKDCPAYMKEMDRRDVNVYYPKRSLPDEESWITIDPPQKE